MFRKMVTDLADTDYPPRTIWIDMYTRVLEGRLYDHINYPFCIEYDSSGAYIQLRDRRPSATYNMCELVVDDSTSLTFGSDHFPEFVCEDDTKLKFINDLVEECHLNLKMLEGSKWGSVGSVVFMLRIMEGRVFVDVKKTIYLTPVYSLEEPDKLTKIIEKYKVSGQQLLDLGYPASIVKDSARTYWFMREWDDQDETWFFPTEVHPESGKAVVFKKDKKRSKHHGFGFVPMLWVKNLPQPGSVDGQCTFKAAIPINIEVDYQLSQGGRGLKYSSDPTTVLRLDDPSGFNNTNARPVANPSMYLPDGSLGSVNSPQAMGFPMGQASRQVIKSANNALIIGKDDDATLLEISGKASTAVIEYVRFLREIALETIHGNRANTDKVNAAQSGKAQQAMNQALIWLADKLRITYGGTLISLINMIIQASHVMPVIVGGEAHTQIDMKKKITLKWPQWYPNTPQDNLQVAQAMQTSADAQQLSNETAVMHLADTYGIRNVKNEMKQIESDQAKLMQQQPKVQKIIKA